MTSIKNHRLILQYLPTGHSFKHWDSSDVSLLELREWIEQVLQVFSTLQQNDRFLCSFLIWKNNKSRDDWQVSFASAFSHPYAFFKLTEFHRWEAKTPRWHLRGAGLSRRKSVQSQIKNDWGDLTPIVTFFLHNLS